MAPKKINLPADKRAIAEEFGRRLYYYESATESHAYALRKDPVGYSAAYKKYASLSPDHLGTLPSPSDLERCIRESEKLLSKTSLCAFDHLLATNAGLFLTHALLRKISEDYEYKVLLAALGLQTELTSIHSSVVPADLMELLPLDPNRMSVSGHFGREDGGPPPDSAAPRFRQESSDGYTSHPVTPSIVAAYKLAPQSALRHVFLGQEADDHVVFRVTSVNFTEDDIIYSVLFADDTEDIEFPSDMFYTTIIEMQLVDG
ncbi:hypothetical protein B0H11DRAFT_2067699 [Mycena galericulata]|nr:hypothetical protein B0H11DRAFT_2067699 [Mycena galericulata]